MYKKIIFIVFFLKFNFFCFYALSSEKIYFIGHLYGAHGEKNIPYEPLAKFIKNNPSGLLILGGDITEDANNFHKFHYFFSKKNILYARGNHDENLYEKVKYWDYYNYRNFNFIHLDMGIDMNFDIKKIIDRNKIFISHHVFFNNIFEYFNPANSMHNNNGINIEATDFGINNIYLAGDCGLYKFGYSYIETEYKSNKFICTGLGSGWSENAYDINENKPVFFDSDGKIIKSFCLLTQGKLNNQIKVCLPYHFNSIFVTIKFYRTIYFKK